jgi:type I restriction enzyme R subunit
MRGIPEKLRAIADEYLKSQGIEQKVAPISIMDEDFQKNVNRRKREKTKAAEVEHAIRHYIDLNFNEDPELFSSFAEMLEQILAEFKDNWEKIYEELEKLRQAIKAKEQEETYGLDRKRQMPIFGMLKARLFDNRDLSEDEIAQVVDLTQNTFNLIEREIRSAGFWNSIPSQNRLRAELQKLFVSPRFSTYPHILNEDIRKPLITDLIQWAKDNHDKIIMG